MVESKAMMLDDAFSYSPMREMEGKICWHINDLCNFKCKYCFFPYFTKENPEVGRLSPEQIVEAFNKTGRRWHLYIAGGEPFLYPNFVELVNQLKPYHPIQISTNLFNKNVKDFVERVTPENIIMINGSLHIAHHNKSSLAQFISNYHLFLEKGFNIVVTYVTYPPLFSRMEEDFKYMREQGIKHIHPLTFQGEYEGKKYPGNYTKEQIKLIRDLSIDKREIFVTANKLNFKNKLCRAGKDYFYMEIDGEVYKCGTIRESCGNLFAGTFNPADHPMTCPMSHCNDSGLGVSSLVEEPTLPNLNLEPDTIFQKQFQKVKEFFLTNA
jgi:MoaA/NifB/PqqE/SkfB family radical SAM enzyme